MVRDTVISSGDSFLDFVDGLLNCLFLGNIIERHEKFEDYQHRHFVYHIKLYVYHDLLLFSFGC